MPRGKLGMKLIENPKKRRETYKNRRDGLVKKASQLSTLCGIDVLLVCFDPGQDGRGAAAAVMTWPADRDAALDLVKRYRETPADKIKHDLSAATYYQEELAKQQRKLLRVERRGSSKLAAEDWRLADLSAAEAYALLDTLDDALLKVQRRIVALGGHIDDDYGVGDVASATTAMVTMPAAPMPLAAGYNSFDLAFGMLEDAGGCAMVTQYYYPPQHDMLPQLPGPVQPPCLGYQMPPPCLGYHQVPPPGFTYQFQMPPPPPPMPMPPFDYDVMAATGTIGIPPFTTNFADGAPLAAGFYDGFVPGFDAFGGGGIFVDDYVAGGQGFAAGHAGAIGYQDEHRRMPAGVWPVCSLDGNANHMGADAFQLSGFAGLPDSSSSTSSFQGGFLKK